MPTDIRSFMRSYLPATESNTPRTRRRFSASATSSNPKCVDESFAMAALRFATRARGREPVEVASPELVLASAEIVQVVPGIDARVVAIGEPGTHCVVSDRFHLAARHVG